MRTVKVIMDRVEVCQYDASVMKDVDSFNIYTATKDFLKREGYADASRFCYDVDYEKHIVHIYEFTSKEVEL